jgi:hypothetical protein
MCLSLGSNFHLSIYPSISTFVSLPVYLFALFLASQRTCLPACPLSLRACHFAYLPAHQNDKVTAIIFILPSNLKIECESE